MAALWGHTEPVSLRALVADGLFVRSGLFYVLPEVSLKPLEDLSGRGSSRVWPQKSLLLPASAKMLRVWKHYGFNVHRSRRVLPDERVDLDRLARYMIRSPFAVEKRPVHEANRSSTYGSVIYHSGMNPKIQRNVEIFTPCDVIAALTQHLPDKSFQLVRYYE